MTSNKGNMDLQERLHQDIKSAWQDIVYDETFEVTQPVAVPPYNTDGYTVYDMGQDHQIVFFIDTLSGKDAADIRNIIRKLSRQFPVCTRYKLTLGDIEDGIRQQVLLLIESAL